MTSSIEVDSVKCIILLMLAMRQISVHGTTGGQRRNKTLINYNRGMKTSIVVGTGARCSMTPLPSSGELAGQYGRIAVGDEE
jgi:hypothetical protein